MWRCTLIPFMNLKSLFVMTNTDDDFSMSNSASDEINKQNTCYRMNLHTDNPWAEVMR